MSDGLELFKTEITPEKLREFAKKHSTREVNKTFGTLGKNEKFHEFFESKIGADILGASIRRLDDLAKKNIDVLLDRDERAEYVVLRHQVIVWMTKILDYEKHRDKVIRG